jgi:hypothetical protein
VNLGSDWLGAGPSGAQALGLDYGRLVASLAAVQAASRTAVGDVASNAPLDEADPVDALVLLFAGQPGWGGAVTALGGSFSPVVAQALATSDQRGR